MHACMHACMHVCTMYIYVILCYIIDYTIYQFIVLYIYIYVYTYMVYPQTHDIPIVNRHFETAILASGPKVPMATKPWDLTRGLGAFGAFCSVVSVCDITTKWRPQDS